jgi:ABC-type amino acid transport substrate-binding protein
MSDAERVNSLLQGIKDLVAQYPRLSIPAGAVALLLVAATMFRTLFDGFKWFTDNWGMTGGGIVIITIVLISIASNYAVKHFSKARPVIDPLPAEFLSRHPTIRWKYDGENNKETSYKVIVTPLDSIGKPAYTQPVKTLCVPKRVMYRELRKINGSVEIKVVPSIRGCDLKASRAFRSEIYEDSLRRIELTNQLRVGVHADAGENVFCYTDDDDWCGFDIEMANLYAHFLRKDLNLSKAISVVPIFYPWPEVISSPNTYEVDMAIASITISSQREVRENIIFSTPYASTGLGVVANVRGFGHLMGSPITLEHMHGKKVAVHAETTAESFVTTVRMDPAYQDIEFHIVESNQDLQSLRNYAFDFVIYDHKRCYSLVEPGMFVERLEHSLPIPPDEYGVAFCRANVRFRDRMNKFIDQHREQLTTMLDARLEAILKENLG